MSFPATTVLVTGAKSGIGKGLLARYMLRPNTLAIAAIRDGPESAAASSLTSLPVGPGSQVVVAKYDAVSPDAAVELVSHLKSTHGVTSLDVVIASAGILKHYGPVKDISPETLRDHFTTPKFFVISSSIGSNTLMDSYSTPMLAYGLPKAAVNFALGRIHREEDRIVVVPVQPGWVQTAMGETAASFRGKTPNQIPVKVEDSVTGLLSLFDQATKEQHSGKFYDQKHNVVPW